MSQTRRLVVSGYYYNWAWDCVNVLSGDAMFMVLRLDRCGVDWTSTSSPSLTATQSVTPMLQPVTLRSSCISLIPLLPRHIHHTTPTRHYTPPHHRLLHTATLFRVSSPSLVIHHTFVDHSQ